MRILIANKYLYPKGGAETYVFRLGAALLKRGHEVQYFGMADERNIAFNRAGAYTGGIDFHKASPAYLTYPFRIIYSRGAARKIRAVINDFKPDVLHLNNFSFQLTPSVIYEAKKCGIPIVYTAHDVQLVCPNHKLRNGLTDGLCRECYGGSYLSCIRHGCVHSSKMRSALAAAEAYVYKRAHTYRKIDKIICPSRFMENELCHNQDLAGRTVMLYNFIEELAPRGVMRGNYVIYFGRYSVEKGIKTLLRAARALPDIQFVFAGRGELEDEINSVPNIRNLGFVTGGRLNEAVEGALFTVLPSEWSENCPFTVMESQTLRTPVLGADIGGIPELIEEGVTGMLFESGNGDVLTEKIRYLYDNPALCGRMSEGCKNLSYDTADTYAEKIERIYAELRKKS